jgi:hypothetical protein
MIGMNRKVRRDVSQRVCAADGIMRVRTPTGSERDNSATFSIDLFSIDSSQVESLSRSLSVAVLYRRPLKRTLNILGNLIQEWRASRLPLATLFHACGVMRLTAAPRLVGSSTHPLTRMVLTSGRCSTAPRWLSSCDSWLCLVWVIYVIC